MFSDETMLMINDCKKRERRLSPKDKKRILEIEEEYDREGELDPVSEDDLIAMWDSVTEGWS